MSEHNDEMHGQMIDRIFRAAQAVVVDHIACNTQHKIAALCVRAVTGKHKRGMKNTKQGVPHS